MTTYRIIPDSAARFQQLLAAVLDERECQALKDCRIKHVEIDTTDSVWELLLETPRKLPASLVDKMADALKRQCRIKNVFVYENSIDLGDCLDYRWPRLVKRVAGGNQTVTHLLANARRDIDGTTLTLDLQGELAAEIMTAHGVKQKLQELLAEMFDKTYLVEYRTVVDQENVIKHDDETPTYVYVPSPVANTAEKSVSRNGNYGGTPSRGSRQQLFGKTIKDKIVPINDITEEERSVVVEGQISSFDGRELRSGRFMISFDIADASNGISCKIFFRTRDEYDTARAKVSNGMNAIVKGSVKFDTFVNDLVMFVDAINKVDKEKRRDTAEIKRVELHAHTQMSNMDAVVSVKDLVNTAAQWGHPAVAITDHGVVQAFPEAYEVASKAKIKIIYGMEGYLFTTDINKSYHIILLAKNHVGLINLYRLVSLSHLKYLHRTPRLPRKVIDEYREGLIIGSACEAGEVIQAIVNGSDEQKLLEIASFYDYLEIQPIGNNAFLVRDGKIADDDGLRQINLKVAELAKKLGRPLVATGDVHFLNPEDEIYRRILMTGKGFGDADMQPPLYFRTTEEMLGEFSYLGAADALEAVVHNPRRIADMIESFKPIPDELYSPQIPGADDAIRDMSYSKARQLYGDELPDIVQKRLQLELDSIIGHGFSVLYFIAHKLVKKSLDDGYLVGSRGSVGSSFVATMTDITEVNPLPPHWHCPNCRESKFEENGNYGSGFDLPDKDCPKCGARMIKDGHDIPFAVFMGFDGDKVPDIDLNFSGDYQPVAHKYTEELFGKDNVFRAGTIATVADKTAYGYVKNYFADKGVNVRNAFINNLITGCTGVKRTTGQHPGGIMVIPRNMDVHHFTPVQRPADDKNTDTITTHFDYHSISSRLVKLDILGHDDPTVIKMLEDLTGRDPKTIPFDDAATMSLFSSTEALGVTPENLGSQTGTYGIPEFGTKFVRQMLDDTKPRTFSELVRISGFSHGTDVWLNNAQDLIKSGTAKLSEAISARDDIMIYLMQKGVEPLLAFKTMENVRKGKGIKEDVVAELKANKVPDWYIESCQKIKYMFPKAHAVAYVMMAYRIAYCKVHYPLAFYAAYFTVRAGEFDVGLVCQGGDAIKRMLADIERKGNAASVKEKALQTVLEIALEMCLRDFYLERVDLYKSSAVNFVIHEKSLLPPLSALDGVGFNAAKSIVEARAGREFISIDDLKNRAGISKTVIETLREHGCLDGMPESDQIELFA